jgi:transcriptional regulator with XRE-family HTH domain
VKRYSERIIQTVAKNVKHYRESLDLSQEKLAECCNVHRNYIGRVERAELDLSLLHLAALAKGLKVKPFRLLLDTQDINALNLE